MWTGVNDHASTKRAQVAWLSWGGLALVGLLGALLAPPHAASAAKNSAAAPSPSMMFTYAGGGAGDGGRARSAGVSYPGPMAFDAAGNLYVVDILFGRIRRITPTGLISSVAGNAELPEYQPDTGGPVPWSHSGSCWGADCGDGGPAIKAPLNHPNDVAFDPSGNLYVADVGNNRVRRIDSRGTISTVAGGGSPAFCDPVKLALYPSDAPFLRRLGDGGPATRACLFPTAVAADGHGNLYIADATLCRVRKVDSLTGIITTVAGNGTCLDGGDGGPATAASLYEPDSLSFDKAGRLYIAQWGDGRIRRMGTNGVMETVAGGGTCQPDQDLDSGDGGPARRATLCGPASVRLDAAGDLYVADRGGDRVRRVDQATGVITTVAGDGATFYGGDGGPATSAGLPRPDGVGVDAAGNVVISEWTTRIRRVDHATGIISTLAGNGSGPDATPNAPGLGDGYSGDGLRATAATLQYPAGVAVSPGDNLYIADTENNRVRAIDHATGIITTVAGTGVQSESGDGGPAARAALNQPAAVAFDAAGDLYVADYGNGPGVVRMVDHATGAISTVAGGGTCTGTAVGDGGPAIQACLSLGIPAGLAVDSAGNLYISDTYHYRVREVSKATGIITSVAGNGTFSYLCGACGDGGPATSSSVSTTGLTFDAAGELVISDTGHDLVRKVDSTGTISTIAGSVPRGKTPFANASYTGDGGPATKATLFGPYGIAFDGSGVLYIAAGGNASVRKVDAGGTITTAAGVGEMGLGGDGGPPTLARMFGPDSVTLDREGNVYLADAGNWRVRVIGAALPSGPAAGVAPLRPAMQPSLPSSDVPHGVLAAFEVAAAQSCQGATAAPPITPQGIDIEPWSSSLHRTLGVAQQPVGVDASPPRVRCQAASGQTPPPAGAAATPPSQASPPMPAGPTSAPASAGGGWSEASDGTPMGSWSSMAYDQATGSAVALALTPSLSGDATWVLQNGAWREQHQTPVSPHLLVASMVYDEATKQAVLFGGISYQLVFGLGGFTLLQTAVAETWTWDGATWTKANPPASPSPRINTAMAYDAATRQVVLFGGFTVDPTTGALSPTDETWVWNGTTWTKGTPAAAPSPRAGAAMAYDSARQRVVLFGGYGGTACGATGICADQGDTWTWDGSSWTAQATPGPRARAVAAFAEDPTTRTIVLFGGAFDNADGTFSTANDTWTFDGTNWSQQHPAEVPPARVLAATSFAGSAGVALFGGETLLNPLFLDDTWTWDGTDWHQVVPAPSPRDALGMAYDEARGQLVVFGGERYTTPVNLRLPAAVGDTWTFDGKKWTQRHPARSPSGGAYGTMTYDAATKQVVLLQGQGCGPVASDCTPADPGCSAMASCTWTWDGTTWTERHPAHRPPTRLTATMAYDTATGEVVLFGGAAVDGCDHVLYVGVGSIDGCALNDTWTWDGTDWTERHPAHNPVVRNEAGMGYDAANGTVVLYGGWAQIDGGYGVGGFVRDTWTWDGVDWTVHAGGPPILRTPVLAYSARLGKLVMFGGMYGYAQDPFDAYPDFLEQNSGGNSYFVDATWTWDGTSWSQMHPATSPPARGYAAAAADPATGAVIVFGGTGFYRLNDLWSYNP